MPCTPRCDRGAPAPRAAAQWGFTCTATSYDNNPTDGVVSTADPKCDIDGSRGGLGPGGGLGSGGILGPAGGQAGGGQSGSPVWDPDTNVRGVVSYEWNSLFDRKIPIGIGFTQARALAPSVRGRRSQFIRLRPRGSRGALPTASLAGDR
jgi:hypothetical protein